MDQTILLRYTICILNNFHCNYLTAHRNCTMELLDRGATF